MRLAADHYTACLAMPFGALGVRIESAALTALEFLPAGTPSFATQEPLIEQLQSQLQAYLADPHFHFDLPLRLSGTPFRLRVWQALMQIAVGETRTYGELARQLDSSPRAVGQALGDNPVPIIVPCHRVVSSIGLGGFNHHAAGAALEVKRWLLRHEHAI
ncbi:MAG: methylated-DNA--[protein]-cysteine S-methyltransferase [Hydrogenophilaceae bacterium]|nr:methylated-DNA--[protein]-cysteine S-methyltransferase [Hydrogenophilaceae bacterium]